eukprot:Em0009g195a
MEEESSDMDNVNDRYTLCTEEAEEQPTSAADDLHLEDRNVNVMENADAYQETEVVLDSDYDDLAFDCTGCSTPEGSKTDRDCDQFGITMSPGLWLDQYHNLAPKEGNDEYSTKIGPREAASESPPLDEHRIQHHTDVCPNELLKKSTSRAAKGQPAGDRTPGLSGQTTPPR